ncbi:MAG: ferritin-like domain-containing protein [Rhodospirillaceae bacterium]|nr:ferritin-like domain-containing protein [Rhodospirillaceae bacterium]
MKNWTLDDISWQDFNPHLVKPELVPIVKAASMVESNAADYATYLKNVFHDDLEFQDAARDWAVEEVQHGQALGRWAEMVDPTFNYQSCFKRFAEGYKIAVNSSASIRGSRSGELIARCIVETGTTSYYTALRDASQEPLLKEICRLIAADEFRHYKLFYIHLKRYLKKENVGKLRRLIIALGRMWESEGDDELPYAYYAANSVMDNSYSHSRYSAEYGARVYPLYQQYHLRKASSMVMKAVGLEPQGQISQLMTKGLTKLVAYRGQKLRKQVIQPQL